MRCVADRRRVWRRRRKFNATHSDFGDRLAGNSKGDGRCNATIYRNCVRDFEYSGDLERGRGRSERDDFGGGIVHGASDRAEPVASDGNGDVAGGLDEVRDGDGDGRATAWDGRGDPQFCLVTPLYDTELQRSNH